jgi:hypothetical protein
LHAGQGQAAASGLAFQILQLVGLVRPFLRVGEWVFFLCEVRPVLGEVRVQLQKFLLILRQFVFRVNSVHRALWLTQRTVDAFIRVYDEKVWAFIKTIYRAYLNAIGVLATNTVISNYKSHVSIYPWFGGV